MALQAVVFDWAGTVIDHGSLAPVLAFQRAFKKFGVDVTVDEVRGPMGRAKRDHVAELLSLPRIAAAWIRSQGTAPDQVAIDAVLGHFIALTIDAATARADLIGGAAETVARLRQMGLKIGSTTGYTRPIMQRIAPMATAQGFAPDSLICAGDQPMGRPAPLMMYQTFLNLNVWPASAVVKVDDTDVGIAEGLNAGCWTVAVAMTGNACGLSAEETAALTHEDFAKRQAKAHSDLAKSGAHYVIDSVADLVPIITDINARLVAGEQP